MTWKFVFFFSIVEISGKPENIKRTGVRKNVLLTLQAFTMPMPQGRASHNRLSSASSWCFNHNLLRPQFVTSLLPEGYEAIVKLTLIICKVYVLIKAFSSFPSRLSRAPGLSPPLNRCWCSKREGAYRVAKLFALKAVMFHQMFNFWSFVSKVERTLGVFWSKGIFGV